MRRLLAALAALFAVGVVVGWSLPASAAPGSVVLAQNGAKTTVTLTWSIGTPETSQSFVVSSDRPNFGYLALTRSQAGCSSTTSCSASWTTDMTFCGGAAYKYTVTGYSGSDFGGNGSAVTGTAYGFGATQCPATSTGVVTATKVEVVKPTPLPVAVVSPDPLPVHDASVATVSPASSVDLNGPSLGAVCGGLALILVVAMAHLITSLRARS